MAAIDVEAIARLDHVSLRGSVHSLPDQIRIGAGSFHTFAELRIVDPAAMDIAHQVHHMLRFQRRMRLQPFDEQVFDLERQAEQG